jgi:hypothetical protein
MVDKGSKWLLIIIFNISKSQLPSNWRVWYKLGNISSKAITLGLKAFELEFIWEGYEPKKYWDS